MGDTGQDFQQARAEAIVQHLCARATEQNSNPPPAARTETIVLEATVHPRAVHAVVRLLKVEESEAPLAAIARGSLLEPVHLLEVEEHVVGDVAAGDKGRLGDGQDVIGRAAHAQSKNARHELVVAVEEGDGAVALVAITRLAAALIQADDEAEALGSGEGSDGGGILEGLLESGNEEGGEMLLEGGIKLVRQPIRPRPLTTRRLGDGGKDAVGREVRHAVRALSLGRCCHREPLGRGREESSLGVGRSGADGKERGIVVGNGISSRRTLSGVIGGEGVQYAISRTDREGGVKGVDLMGKRMKPECAALTVVLPEDVHRPPRLHRLLLFHRPQACPCVIEGAQRQLAVMWPRRACTLRRTTHAPQPLAGCALRRRLQHAEIAGDVSGGEFEQLPPVARREVVVLLGERGEQRRHLIHVALIIQHPERQRPHAAAAGGLQGRLQRELNCGVVAGQELVGTAGEDLDSLDPLPQVHGSEPAVQPCTREVPRTSGPREGAAVSPPPHLRQQPRVVQLVDEHQRLKLVTPRKARITRLRRRVGVGSPRDAVEVAPHKDVAAALHGPRQLR